jgi:hypothetical protein
MSPDGAGAGASEASAEVCNSDSFEREINRWIVTESEQTKPQGHRDALVFSYGYATHIRARHRSSSATKKWRTCSESRNSEVHSIL